MIPAIRPSTTVNVRTESGVPSSRVERHREQVVQHERQPLARPERLEDDKEREPDRIGERHLVSSSPERRPRPWPTRPTCAARRSCRRRHPPAHHGRVAQDSQPCRRISHPPRKSLGGLPARSGRPLNSRPMRDHRPAKAKAAVRSGTPSIALSHYVTPADDADPSGGPCRPSTSSGSRWGSVVPNERCTSSPGQGERRFPALPGPGTSP